MRLREIITPVYDTRIDEDWEENLQQAKEWAYTKLFKSDMPIMTLATTAAAIAGAVIIAKVPMLRAIEVAIGGTVLKDLYSDFTSLQDQYARYNAGDYHTELFGNASKREAAEIADNTKSKIMGEVIISAGALTRSSSKAFNFLNKLVGGTGSFAGKTVGGLFGGSLGKKYGGKLGGLAGMPFKVGAGLAKMLEGGVKGVAFQGFLESDVGKEFMDSAVMQYITTGTAEFGEDVYSRILSTLQSLGVNVPDAIKPDAKEQDKVAGSSAQTPQSGRVVSDNPKWQRRPLLVAYDKGNPKIMYVNNIQITDADGFQLVGDNMLNSIKDSARIANNAPDPTAGIPKKPGTRYSY